MPKSFLGPVGAILACGRWIEGECALTAGVVAGRQEDTTGGLALADDMAGGGGGQNTVLADKELLDTVGGANLGNQLDDLGVPEAAVTTDDEERACEGGLSVSGVVTTRGSLFTLNTLRDGKQNARDESLAVVRLLENSDLLAKTRTMALSAVRLDRGCSVRGGSYGGVAKVGVIGVGNNVRGELFLLGIRTFRASGPGRA